MMDWQAILGLVFRWLHILAAVTAVGGTIFARLVVVPTLDPLPADERTRLHAAMRARWSKIVAVAIAALLVSGLYNIGVAMTYYRLPRWYNAVFGVKFLLALAIFAIASFLTGKTPVADAMRRNLRFWLNLNVALAVAVICLSGVLRMAVKVPKSAVEPQPPSGAKNALQPADS